MRLVLRYLRTRKTQAVLAPLFKMLEASFELIVPVIVARMIDVGVYGNDRGYLLRMGLILLLLACVGLLSSITAQYFAAKVAVSCGTQMRSDLFGHIQDFSHADIDTLGTSALITRMTSDINQVQNGINMFLRLFLRSPFVVLGAVLMSFFVGGRTALVTAVAVLLLFLIIRGFLRLTMPLFSSVQKKLDRVLSRTRQNLHGVRVIRAFRAEERELSGFRSSNSELLAAQKTAGRVSALLNPLTMVIVNLGIVLLFFFGRFRLAGGGLSTGQIIALVNYMSQILVELIKLSNLIVLLSRSFASAGRIQDVFDRTSALAGGDQPVSENGIYEVRFDHVSFSYPGAQKRALSDISFSARRGMTVGIIGPTGSGKSSLVSLIPRFYDATEGTVSVDQKDVRTLSLDALRAHIGVVPQRAVLFSGTLRENMQWGDAAADDAQIRRALAQAQADGFALQVEEGLDAPVSREGRNYSGGQRQRLTIARALVRDPAVLILDDSTSALDYLTDAKFRETLREGSKDRLTFLVSQRVGTVRDADLILVLNDGALAGSGTHEELLRSCPVYKEICDSQDVGGEVTFA